MTTYPHAPGPVRRASNEAMTQAVLAAAAVCATALLGAAVDVEGPGGLDRRARRLAQSPKLRRFRPVLTPLFPLGLPISYMTASWLVARRLRLKNRRGGPAIMTSAGLGWLAHRLATLALERDRPYRSGAKRRTDSYPSGHTTGVTAVALTTAYVLERQQLISRHSALAIGIAAPAIMGIYRVLADAHWATDVVGGWLLGGGVGLACNAVLADSLTPSPPPRVRNRRPGLMHAAY